MEENKFSLKHYLVFFIMPLFSAVFYLKYMKSAERVIGLLMYVFICVIISALLWKAVSVVSSHFDIRKLNVTVITAAALAAIDHLIKLVLSKTGFETSIIGKYLMIKHSHNLNQNGIFNHLNIETSQLTMIFFKAAILAAVICLYKLFKTETARKAYVFVAASALANFLDTLFYGYTLDYVYFYKVMTYDLKDFYVDAGWSVIFMLIFINEIKKSKEKKKVN